ncbi:MAG: helix-turn-helix transcriptional regulator [Hyphomicrobiales bacterium]|nr:helix-turn-helix transcriptional regulator [Hyphomicrobiales bacterium]
MVTPNRIRELRRSKGWTLNELAAATGTSGDQISKLERGARRLSLDWMERLANVLGCTPAALIQETGSLISVTGIVGSNGEVTSPDHAPPTLHAPPGVSVSNGLRAVIVGKEANSLLFRPGWQLFYYDSPSVPEECINTLCITKVRSGPLLIREVRRGNNRVRYHLLGHPAELQENVALDWAAKIIAIVPA